mmetsp:Transcript_10584/g.20403  ORF Transcript_10584/g.20403 Transcript_10584/m.20403 type:complete len:314 (+) Transcript_10584:1448-2389(+)
MNRANTEEPMRKRRKVQNPVDESDQEVNSNEHIPEPNPVVVFFQIKVEDFVIGKIEIELFNDVPIAAENFRSLCTGEHKGTLVERLHYKRSLIYANRGYYLEGGDIVSNDGNGGESIYGLNFIEQSSPRKHTERGLVSLSCTEANKFNSRFIITLAACPFLDNRNVIVGRVANGLDVLAKLGDISILPNGLLMKRTMIVRCGQLTGPKSMITAEQERRVKYKPVVVNLDDKTEPIYSFCTYCQSNVLTKTVKKISICNWICGSFGCISAAVSTDGLIGLFAFLMGLGIKDCFQVEHNCKECNRQLFVHKPCFC